VIRTACTRDCPDACGILAEVENGRIVRLQGDPHHPVTQGFLCYRTSRYLERQYAPDRLTTPLLRRGGRFVPLSWDDALDRIAENLAGAWARLMPGLKQTAAPQVRDDREANLFEFELRYEVPAFGTYERGTLTVEAPAIEILDTLVGPREGRREMLEVIDEDDEIYRTQKEKLAAIVQSIAEAASRGQPILVGTTSIEKSEQLSALLKDEKYLRNLARSLDDQAAAIKPGKDEELRKHLTDMAALLTKFASDAKGKRDPIVHNVLNARYHEQEAPIVAQAGVPGAVTIATNMAGRGTDIQLGGNSEFRLRDWINEETAKGTPPDEAAITKKRGQARPRRWWCGRVLPRAGALLDHERFAIHAIPDAGQVLPRLVLSGVRRQIDAAVLHHLPYELQALVVARRRGRLDEIAETDLEELRGLRLRGRKITGGGARQFGERRPVQPQIQDRVFVAFCEAGANFGIVLRNPSGPCCRLCGRIATAE